MVTRVWLLAFAAPWALACDGLATAPNARPSAVVTATFITNMKGTGSVGDGAPTYAGGVNTQVLTFEAGVAPGGVYGTLDYTDSAFFKQDGNPPHFVVGPQYAGTGVTTFVQTSDRCVEFDGRGYLINTGEHLVFRIQACDNGSPGAGLDTFFIEAPERLLTDGAAYRVGPYPLTTGDISAITTSIGSS